VRWRIVHAVKIRIKGALGTLTVVCRQSSNTAREVRNDEKKSLATDLHRISSGLRTRVSSGEFSSSISRGNSIRFALSLAGADPAEESSGTGYFAGFEAMWF
jgi:hypothetical protein